MPLFFFFTGTDRQTDFYPLFLRFRIIVPLPPYHIYVICKNTGIRRTFAKSFLDTY